MRTRLLLLFLAHAACTGLIAEPGTTADPHGSPIDPVDPGVGSVPPVVVPLSTTIRRLNRTEYENTVTQLLGDTGWRGDRLPADPTGEGFDTDSAATTVAPDVIELYLNAAEDLAALAELGTLVPCDATAPSDACVRGFVRDFGKRCFRRPLSSDEAGELFDFYAVRKAEDTPEHALRALVARFLQEPSFLYRVELSGQGQGDAKAALSSWEMASRLSYFLWRTMPDDELMAAAEADALKTPDQVAAQTDRMLADRRARLTFRAFHDQWLQLDSLDSVRKDPDLYPGFEADILPLLKVETETFLDKVIWEGPGDLRTLLTAPYSYASSTLAPLYGATAPGADFVRVDLDPARRAGLLTQASFLARYAHPDRTAPILRGVFLLRRLTCAPPPERPAGVVVDDAPPDAGTTTTTREYYANLTNRAECRGCHVSINGAGFAFERYDAIGAYRDTENGKPVDASGTIVLDGQKHTVGDAVELAHAMAESPQVAACVTTHWFRFAYGRTHGAVDRPALDALEKRFRDSNYKITELVRALAQSDVFFAPNYSLVRHAP